MTEPLTNLQAIGKEARRDKWLAFALCVVLLVVWYITRAELVGTLLTAAIGGFLGLLKNQEPERI